MQEFRRTLSKANQCRPADLGRRRAGDPPDLRKPFHEVDLRYGYDVSLANANISYDDLDELSKG